MLDGGLFSMESRQPAVECAGLPSYCLIMTDPHSMDRCTRYKLTQSYSDSYTGVHTGRTLRSIWTMYQSYISISDTFTTYAVNRTGCIYIYYLATDCFHGDGQTSKKNAILYLIQGHVLNRHTYS